MRKFGCDHKFEAPTFRARGGLKLTHELVQDVKQDICDNSTLGHKQVILCTAPKTVFYSMY